MQSTRLEKVLSRRSRILVHCLIISGTLNFALIATFMTFILKERHRVILPLAQTEEKVKRIYLRHEDVLEEFSKMSYDALVRELYVETHVERGQRRCDLALAALATYHDFDVERAFAGLPIEKREVDFQGQSLVLFPSLSQECLEGVRLFARREMWPLTPKGLLKEIHKRKEVPATLREAFCLTQEYFEIQKAFKHLPYAIGEEALFDLITAGEWHSIENFSVEDFPSFLVPRIEKGVELASYLLVLLDREFALKHLDDAQMEGLIALLKEKTPEVEAFLAELQGGIRSDRIQKLAGKPLENPPRRYVVQYGDSLWKISQAFDVRVDAIRKLNDLSSETLQVGMELSLPPE